jgi:hypothetical protein
VGPIIRTFGEDLVGWFDIEGLPVMQEARRTRVDSATKVFAMGVPFNEINRTYDLGFPELAWGDKGYLPFSLQPADAVDSPEPDEDDAPGKPTEGNEDGPVAAMMKLLARAKHQTPNTKHQTPEGKAPNTAALWRRHMRARAATVKVFERKIGRVLNEFRAKTLAKLSEVHLENSKRAQGA